MVGHWKPRGCAWMTAEVDMAGAGRWQEMAASLRPFGGPAGFMLCAMPQTSMTLHPDWIRPRWPAPAHVHAVFTTRAGGVSRPPYDSFNLGPPSGDDPAAVDANRRHLAEAMGHPPVFMQQVHGTTSVVLPPADPPPGV